MKAAYVLIMILLAGVCSLNGQTGFDTEEPGGTVKGKVTTADNKPAPFVNIYIRENRKATITTEDGQFILHHIKPGTYTVVVSHTGLETQEKTITIATDEIVDLSLILKEDSKQLDAVIVEGRRSLNDRPVNIGKLSIAPIDLPQGVTIVGQQVIRDQQAMRLSDVIRNVNGVYLGTARAGTQETFFARGYSFGSYNMFKNGARVNSGAMPEMSGLERVEVLKGSAAILYGNVAPGGILNMVTKQPKFNFGGEVSMRAGSYDLFKPAIDIYGPISKNLAYRLNGTYEKANSFRNEVQSTRYYVNPSFLYKLGKNTDLVLEGDYLYHKFTPDFGIGSYNNKTISDVSRNTFFGAPWQYAKTQQATATATVKHRFNDSWNLSSSVSFQQYERDYFSIERIQFGTAVPAKGLKDGDWLRPMGKTKANEDYYVGQINLNGRFKTGNLEHNLLVGVDADKYLTKTTTYGLPNGGIYDTLNLFDPSQHKIRTDMPVSSGDSLLVRTPIVRFGAYVQDLISLGEHWKLLAGIRWSIQETDPAKTTNYKKGTVTEANRKTDKAFSPRIGLVYKPVPTTAFFASYSNSFSPNNGLDVNNEALKPSIIDQYEVGMKNDFFNGAFSVNVTAYRIVNQNLAQTAQFLPNGQQNNNTNIKELTGQTTSDGVEVDFAAHPVTGLNLLAGYSYNYMRYTKTDPSKNGNFKEGERLVSTPAHTANASAFYTFPQSALKGVKVGVTALYIGDRVAGWNNTIGQAQDYDRRIPIDGFVTVDISAGYTFRNISLLAKVSNLTNTYNYYVHENYSVNPIAPRQVIATLAYKF